ncbi:hypothetical protein AB0L65_61905, partial [Nonomuraea sp. NPDC052116]|uniref:hypothetical protein n=1 Tax=Nonomuraea sp. NPDC052116 TaxID=3155665 RepID=UPI003434E6EE
LDGHEADDQSERAAQIAPVGLRIDSMSVAVPMATAVVPSGPLVLVPVLIGHALSSLDDGE